VALLFSNFMFLPCVMEVRPDVPMVFLALAAVERLLAFMKEGKPGHLPAAAFLAALSFLFLQKAVFLFPVAAAMLAAWRLKGRIGPVLFWKAVAAFLLPVLLFAAWLAATGSFRDYFFCNWLLNARREGAFRLWLIVGRLALVNAVFWLSLAPALWRALRSERNSAALRAVAWFALAAMAALPLLPIPRPSLSSGPAAAQRHRRRLDRGPLPFSSAGQAAGRIPGGAARGSPALFDRARLSAERRAVGKDRLCPASDRPDDRVLDGRCDFNLFRPDVHYFWFQIDPARCWTATAASAADAAATMTPAG